MRSARLSFALDTGVVVLPLTGRIAVFRPRADDDYSALPQDRLLMVQGFRPDHDALAVQGHAVALSAGTGNAAALVCLPRSRAEARAVLAAAAGSVVPGGLVIVDGQKTDGIEAAHRDLKALLPVSDMVSKAHGKLFTFAASPALAGWQAAPARVDGDFITMPGVFSADGADKGSALLAAALPGDLAGHVVDLGAGWGYLARAVLLRPKVKHLDLVEAEAVALDCAKVNISDPRAAFHWADATRWRPARPADTVVCNPPFHAARAADPGLGAAFIRAAAAMLHPGGVLWLVANRHLPYAPVLAETFRDVAEVALQDGFRVTRAARPARPRHP